MSRDSLIPKRITRKDGVDTTVYVRDDTFSNKSAEDRKAVVEAVKPKRRHNRMGYWLYDGEGDYEVSKEEFLSLTGEEREAYFSDTQDCYFVDEDENVTYYSSESDEPISQEEFEKRNGESYRPKSAGK